MDDHNHPHHHNHQQPQPFMISADLRRILRPPHQFHQHVPPPDLVFPHHYDLMHQMVGARPLTDLLSPAAAGLHDFPDSVAVHHHQPPPSAAAAASSTPRATFDCDSSGFGGDNGSGRWPRQETLTLLEIRSRLDSKFKEANQKGPLWDEVSRMMCEEHGFQRSGKKCREKFENLYKYYKKTKEGKAGRQDGKHYRFFRQLEALCGDTAAAHPACLPEAAYTPTTFYSGGGANTSNPNSLSLSADAEPDPNSSEDQFESSSSDDHDSLSEKERKRRGCSSSLGKSYWKGRIKGFIDEQMRKVVEKQEAWLEKLTTTLEKKEEERRVREEEWRRQEAARMERERRFWARERGWIEARDTALVEALQNLTGKVVLPARVSFPDDDDDNLQEEQEEEEEDAEENQACNNDDHHHETGNATDCGGRGEGRKKRKGYNINVSRSSTSTGHCNYSTTQDHQHDDQDHQIERMHGSDHHHNQVGGVSGANEISCFPFLMSDGDHHHQNFWENYGLKMMNKGDHDNSIN